MSFYFDFLFLVNLDRILKFGSIFEKLSFSTSSKAEQFPPNFYGLVLGLVGLIYEKGIGVAQPISS